MKKWVVAYFFLNLLYAVFSFGFVLPNLFLSQNSLFLKFQVWMWHTVFENPAVRVYGFLILLILMWSVYLMLCHSLWRQKSLSGRSLIIAVSLIIAPLLFSYNALSADVFNYIFNAKMLTELSANPHISVATDFPAEPMLNFMHNAHTPAPYGYAWTLISVPFYLLGLGKFILQWGMMKLAALLSFALTGWALFRLAPATRRSRFWLAALFFNPLFILEFMSNLHNDLWMMGLGLLSLFLVKYALSTKSLSPLRHRFFIALSVLTLLISINIKFATLILIPVWLWFVFGSKIKARLRSSSALLTRRFLSLITWKEQHLYDLLALIFFLPLLLPRSQQFLPWYLSWSLVWLPLMANKWLKIALLCFSASSLLRYLPWLWHNGYLAHQRPLEIALTFVGATLLFLIVFIIIKITEKHSRVLH